MAKEKYEFLGNIKFPRIGTIACRDFFLTWKQITEFFLFILFALYRIDTSEEMVHKVLFEMEDDPIKKEHLKEKWEKRKDSVTTFTLSEKQQFFLEVLLVRHIENYLNYLSSLLREIFIQRPETLRSSDKVELEAVLKHDSIEDFVKTCAERKVEGLSYSSLKHLQEYFADHFSLTFLSQADFPILNEAVEVRNISVHNRCIINKRFISKTGGSPSLEGTRKKLKVKYLEKIVILLIHSVNQIDRNARKKMRLKSKRFKIEKIEDMWKKADRTSG